MGNMILTDIKAMLRKPFLFIVLLSGLFVGAFAITVYYAYSSIFLKTIDRTYCLNASVEFRLYDADGNDVAPTAVIALLQSGKLPEIRYGGFVCYDLNDADVIGFYSDETELESPFLGMYPTGKYVGEHCALLSNDLVKDPYEALGKSITVGETDYEVIGILPQNHYAGEDFDSRRVSKGVGFLAGTKLNGEELERPENAVYLPITTFAEDGYNIELCRITFCRELSNKETVRIQNIIAEETGIADFVDITQYGQAYATIRWSSAAIYFAAVFAGCFNILAIFGYLLKRNRRQYVIYRMCGATTSKLFCSIAAEVGIYATVVFSLGFAAGTTFLKYSQILRDDYLSATVSDFLLLWGMFLAVMLILSARQIFAVARGSIKDAEGRV